MAAGGAGRHPEGDGPSYKVSQVRTNPQLKVEMWGTRARCSKGDGRRYNQRMAAATHSEKFIVPKSVLSRTVGTETILLNLETSTYHSLNAVGGRFWALIGEGSDFRQALTVMRGEYKVDPEQLEADLRALCAELLELKLLEQA